MKSYVLHATQTDHRNIENRGNLSRKEAFRFTHEMEGYKCFTQCTTSTLVTVIEMLTMF